MLCESSTDYLSDFIVYTGEDTVYTEPSITFPNLRKKWPSQLTFGDRNQQNELVNLMT